MACTSYIYIRSHVPFTAGLEDTTEIADLEKDIIVVTTVALQLRYE